MFHALGRRSIRNGSLVVFSECGVSVSWFLRAQEDVEPSIALGFPGRTMAIINVHLKTIKRSNNNGKTCPFSHYYWHACASEFKAETERRRCRCRLICRPCPAISCSSSEIDIGSIVQDSGCCGDQSLIRQSAVNKKKPWKRRKCWRAGYVVARFEKVLAFFLLVLQHVAVAKFLTAIH